MASTSRLDHSPPAGDFIAAMRQFAGAVNIVATGAGDDRRGFTATAVMSLTAAPPQIVLAVNRTVGAYGTLVDNAAFCVNTLAVEQSRLASVFAGGLEAASRFSHGDWTTLETGSPMLQGAVANLDCRLERRIEFATHDLVVGAVVGVKVNSDLDPLLYVDGQWSGLVPARREMPALLADIEAVGQALSVSSDGGNRARDLADATRAMTRLLIAQRSSTGRRLAEEIYADPAAASAVSAARRSVDDRLVRLLELGRDDGSFQFENARLTALAIGGMLAWVHRWYRAEGALAADEVGDLLSAMTLRMVGAAPQQRGAGL